MVATDSSTDKAERLKYWEAQVAYWAEVLARIRRKKEQERPEPVYDWAKCGVTAGEAHARTNIGQTVNSWNGQAFRLGRGKLPSDYPKG